MRRVPPGLWVEPPEASRSCVETQGLSQETLVSTHCRTHCPTSHHDLPLIFYWWKKFCLLGRHINSLMGIQAHIRWPYIVQTRTYLKGKGGTINNYSGAVDLNQDCPGFVNTWGKESEEFGFHHQTVLSINKMLDPSVFHWEVLSTLSNGLSATGSNSLLWTQDYQVYPPCVSRSFFFTPRVPKSTCNSEWKSRVMVA